MTMKIVTQEQDVSISLSLSAGDAGGEGADHQDVVQ